MVQTVKFFQITLLLLACLGCKKCNNQRLVQVGDCGLPCYPETQKQFAGVGNCNMGHLECADGGTDGGTACVGYTLPQKAVCGTIDYACDNFAQVPAVDCSNVCGIGYQFCINHKLTTCNAPQPNTQNGQFCYDGPPGTAALPGCHPGVLTCGNGYCGDCVNPTCVNEKYPNGDPIQIAFLVGTNMIGDFEGTTNDPASNYDLFSVLFRGATQFADMNTDIGYALVAIPDTNLDNGACSSTIDGGIGDCPFPIVMTDFANNTNFDSALSKMQFGPDGGSGDIPIYNAMLDAANLNPAVSQTFHLNWQSDSQKLIVIWANEEGQSIGYAVSIQQVIANFQSGNILPLVFETTQHFNDGSGYDTLTNTIPQGKLLNINGTNPSDVVEQLTLATEVLRCR